jgi:hypothetical protein
MKGGELEKVVAAVIADATAGREDQAWAKIESLLREARREVSVVLALIGIVAEGHLSTEKALVALAEIYQAHSHSQAVMGALGAALEQARDMDLLNAAPPEHPLFADAVDTLTDLLQTAQEREIEKELLQGLATAARMMARQKDDVVERSYQRLIAIEPKNSSYHYEFGRACLLVWSLTESLSSTDCSGDPKSWSASFARSSARHSVSLARKSRTESNRRGERPVCRRRGVYINS